MVNSSYRKLLVTTVNIVYNVPLVKWADNKVRTWTDLTAYRWRGFTGVWKKVLRRVSSSTNIVGNIKNNIKRLVTSHTNTVSLIFRFVFRYVVNSILNINIRTTNIKRLVTSTVKLIYAVPSEIWRTLLTNTWSALRFTYWWEWHRAGIAGTKRRIERISIGMVNTITSPVKRNIGKIVSGLVSTANTFISRFGKAVVQKIETIAIHNLVYKMEMIWRVGANSRGETLHMVLNETKVIELSVFNEDGTPTDLDGADVKFAVSGTVEKDCGISGNKITVMIEPDDIENTGTYDYEFRLKDIFNRVDSLIIGKVIVEPKVVSAY